jgi:hypothetical protein
MLPAVERRLFRLQPIGQIRRMFTQLVERSLDGHGHFAAAWLSHCYQLQPAALACGVGRSVMHWMRRIDADLSRGKCWLIGMNCLT